MTNEPIHDKIQIRHTCGFLLLQIVWVMAPALCAPQSSQPDVVPILNATDPQVQTLIAERRYDQAEAILVHELRNAPGDGTHMLMLAQLYFNEHRYDESRAMLDAANRVAGATSNGEMLAGLIEVVHDNTHAAKERYERALNLDPRNAPAHYYLGRALYTESALPQAIEEFKAAISLDPSILRAYDGLGLASQALGQRDQAAQWFEQGLDEEKKANGRSSEWLPLDYATFLLQSEATDKASELLQLAYARNPENAEVLYQFGIYNYKRAHYEEALKKLRRAIELAPKDARPHYLAGRCYSALHDRDLADREFSKFRELSPGASTP